MRRFVVICLAVLALAYVVGVPLFLGQDDDPLPSKADAVVALSGSENTLPEAQALVARGLAPTLVVSAEQSGRDEQRARLCRAKPKNVICVYAGPYTSVSEAQAISAVIRRHNWGSVVLVTSDYERLRAGRAFDRCGDFRVATVGVDEPLWRTAVALPLEWVKLAVSETVRRSC
jgi:uncharacterized SAM-binding protein YcdF (DUF218 family)